MVWEVMREEIVQLGERIAVAAVHLDAAMHPLLTDLRAFDEARGWAEQGFRSCAHWLSWRVGWTPATARERLRVARRLGELPAIADELRRGEISYAKVRSITRVADAGNERVLLDYARAATAAQLETICRRFRTAQEAAAGAPDAGAARRRASRRTLEDGMVRIEVVLRADEAAVVWAVLQCAATDVSAEAPDPVDGLVTLAQAYARGDTPDRVPVELLVTVPLATLAGTSAEPAELADGSFASAETARRLACDAGIVFAAVGPAGEPLSVGRKTRTIPASIRRALTHRDRTCRFPGCANRRFVEGHHLRHWADGGETALGNLTLLCSLCRARHNEHYADWRIMPRRGGSSTGRLHAYAA